MLVSMLILVSGQVYTLMTTNGTICHPSVSDLVLVKDHEKYYAYRHPSTSYPGSYLRYPPRPHHTYQLLSNAPFCRGGRARKTH